MGRQRLSVPELKAGITVAAARQALGGAFAAASLESPALDARLLVAHALGLDHTGIARAAERVLSAAEADAVAMHSARRRTRQRAQPRPRRPRRVRRLRLRRGAPGSLRPRRIQSAVCVP